MWEFIVGFMLLPVIVILALLVNYISGQVSRVGAYYTFTGSIRYGGKADPDKHIIQVHKEKNGYRITFIDRQESERDEKPVVVETISYKKVDNFLKPE